MTATPRDAGLRVVVRADHSAAELHVPGGAERPMVTPEACALVLREAGADGSPPVRQAVSELLNSPTDPAQPLRGVVARATPPVHGVDGRVEWLVQTGGTEAAAAPKDPHRVSFYDR